MYAPPPRVGLQPYVCEQWGLDKPIFTGELHVVAPRDGVTCQLRLIDGRSGSLFAQSVDLDMTQLGKSLQIEQFLEGARDSSRYFVIRVKDARSGKIASLGIGFRERVSAFDLHAVLQDRARTIQRHAEFDSKLGLHGGTGAAASMGSDPAASMASLQDDERSQAEERAALARLEQAHVDLALPQGQRIKVVLRPQRGEGEEAASAAAAVDSSESASALSGSGVKPKRRKHKALASVEVAFTHGAGGALMLAPPPPPAPVPSAAAAASPEGDEMRFAELSAPEDEPQIEGWSPSAPAAAAAAASGETDAPTNLSPLHAPAAAPDAAAASVLPPMQLEGGAPGGLQPGLDDAAAAAAADDADDDDFGDFASAK